MSKKSGCTPKPVMRGLHRAMALRNIYTAVTLSVTATLTFYMLYNRRRMNKFKNFYAKYDPDKAFERMRASGYLVSASPDDDDDNGGKK